MSSKVANLQVGDSFKKWQSRKICMYLGCRLLVECYTAWICSGSTYKRASFCLHVLYTISDWRKILRFTHTWWEIDIFWPINHSCLLWMTHCQKRSISSVTVSEWGAPAIFPVINLLFTNIPYSGIWVGSGMVTTGPPSISQEYTHDWGSIHVCHLFSLTQ